MMSYLNSAHYLLDMSVHSLKHNLVLRSTELSVWGADWLMSKMSQVREGGMCQARSSGTHLSPPWKTYQYLKQRRKKPFIQISQRMRDGAKSIQNKKVTKKHRGHTENTDGWLNVLKFQTDKWSRGGRRDATCLSSTLLSRSKTWCHTKWMPESKMVQWQKWWLLWFRSVFVLFFSTRQFQEAEWN